MAYSNDQAQLEPETETAGPVLEFDFDAFKIGVAEYSAGPTGCTVFYFPGGAQCNIDVRGGSVGMLGDYGWTNAICLAGGSLLGLEAATGVAAELFAMKDYSTRFDRIPLVSGAIIYDYGRRKNSIYPDKALGRAALQHARANIFPLGARGAGRSAGVGAAFNSNQSEAAGQGGAFRQLGPIKIAAFSVVNALGSIVDRQGQVVRGGLDRASGRHLAYLEQLETKLAADLSVPESPSGNTTLSVVITNQKLDARTLQQFGRQVHSSMARMIQPFHTIYDGDVLFAVSTGQVEDRRLDLTALGGLASELIWDAVLRSY